MPSPPRRAEGSDAPVWLITGSSTGIGLALARHALSLGHNVIATARQPSKYPEVVAELTSHYHHHPLSGHAQAHFLALDVTAPYAQIEAFVKQAESLHGRIDILVNNAGYCVLGAIEDVPMEKWTEQMATNVFGPVALIKAVLPSMRKRVSFGAVLTYLLFLFLKDIVLCGHRRRSTCSVSRNDS
jgi:NAD(P)-dependent dehydrogenase (short-subunit alcohol dehydrogenase family)